MHEVAYPDQRLGYRPSQRLGRTVMLTAVLVVVSACFLISGCDDFFVDLYHAIRAVYQRLFEGLRPET